VQYSHRDMDSKNPIKAFLDRLVESNFRPKEAQILYMLRGDGPCLLGSVGMEMDMKKSNLSRVLSKLQDRGHIEMKLDSNDPRKKVVSLSEDGAKEADDLFNP